VNNYWIFGKLAVLTAYDCSALRSWFAGLRPVTRSSPLGHGVWNFFRWGWWEFFISPEIWCL